MRRRLGTVRLGLLPGKSAREDLAAGATRLQEHGCTVCYQSFNLQTHSAGAHLINILNGEKQTFLNYQMKGINYWTGLNDMQTEGQFYWDGPVPLKVCIMPYDKKAKTFPVLARRLLHQLGSWPAGARSQP